MRIGVNAGSLEKHLLEKYGEPNPEALVESALEHAQDPAGPRFPRVQDQREGVRRVPGRRRLSAAGRGLRPSAAYRHHRGRRAAHRHGEKSSIGLGTLLWAGIGDTVRVSLSAEPEEEVLVGWEILKSLGLRHRGVKIISCPSCARQGFDVIHTVAKLEERLAHIETPMTLSIIGCVVNGPGEALMTDIGVTGGGGGRHMVYAAGKTDHTIDSRADDRPHRRAGGAARRRRCRGRTGGGEGRRRSDRC